MKKLVGLFFLISVSLIANCQNTSEIKAMITGYKTNDTIKLSDFQKLSEISLNNKDYSIASFTLLFSDGNNDYEYVSKSNKITDEMKDGLSKMVSQSSKTDFIAIKDISVQNSKNIIGKIENLVFRIKK